MVETRKKAKRKHAGDSDQHWSYDDFVMPLLCVCGTHVFIGAGIVTPDKSTCCLIIAVREAQCPRRDAIPLTW